jgi:hypothetical protein
MSGIQSISVNAAQTYASVGSQNQQSLVPFSNLDLTEAQRTKLRSIFTSAKQNGTSKADVQKQVDAVLSPAQQQALTNDLKAGFGHHRPPPPPSADTTTAQASSSPSSSSTTATSADDLVVNAVLNVTNQATAAQSTLIDTLQHSVLATNPALKSTAQ